MKIENFLKYLFSLLNLFAITIHCQNNDMVVTYGVVIDSAFYNKGQNQPNNPLAGHYSNVNKLEYDLKIKNNASTFELADRIKNSLEANKLKVAAALSSRGVYYYNKPSNELLLQKDFMGSLFLITLNNETKWNYTNETKKIQNFLCYKATKIIKFKSGEKTIEKEITAWYCPEIANSFGPKNYNGTPGLILELRDAYVVFCVKTISKVNIPKIEKPTKGIVLKEEEYNKMIQEKTDEFFSEAKKYTNQN
ncbi:GLPGLI family protein [Flavobacterium sp. HNIBRBA15423]|uniref:GLPGLI family protein n=1 Tax=Flavobacterium sp. HNIBRBA15423 TaxID=3458683 RepID=UPI0040446C8F